MMEDVGQNAVGTAPGTKEPHFQMFCLPASEIRGTSALFVPFTVGCSISWGAWVNHAQLSGRRSRTDSGQC